MPSRILRESFLDSENVSKAGELAEVLFVRLLLIVDDFGRFDGRLSVICRRCWPLGEITDPTEVEVLERMSKLIEYKLVIPYEKDGKPFIYIPKFKQRTRATKSKYPDPPDTCPQDAGHMPVNGQTDDGQTPGRWRASASVVRSSSFDIRSSVDPVDKSRSTPRAAAKAVAKTQHQIAAQKRAAETAAPPPPGFMETWKKPVDHFAMNSTTPSTEETINHGHESLDA